MEAVARSNDPAAPTERSDHLTQQRHLDPTDEWQIRSLSTSQMRELKGELTQELVVQMTFDPCKHRDL